MADLYLVAERSADLLTPNDQYRRIAVAGSTKTAADLLAWAQATFAAPGQVVGTAEEATALAGRSGWLVLKMLSDLDEVDQAPDAQRKTGTTMVNGVALCACCGQPKAAYYGPWCPRCEKPVVKDGALNIIQALRHIEALGHKGVEEDVWDWLIDNADIGNDQTIYVAFPKTDATPDDEDEWTNVDNGFKLLRETFGLPETGFRFHFSW